MVIRCLCILDRRAASERNLRSLWRGRHQDRCAVHAGKIIGTCHDCPFVLLVLWGLAITLMHRDTKYPNVLGVSMDEFCCPPKMPWGRSRYGGRRCLWIPRHIWDGNAAVNLSLRNGRNPHIEHIADLRDVAEQLHSEATLAG